jgi:hypothetical protein
MAGIGISNHVVLRDSFGRFKAAVGNAAADSIDEAIDLGERLSFERAPVGEKTDLRSVPLRSAFFKERTSRTQGYWGNAARHALFVEYGTVSHPIYGHPFLRFYWDNAGRNWVPGLFGTPDVVNHPGTPAEPYLRPAYDIVKSRLLDIMKRHYPG